MNRVRSRFCRLVFRKTSCRYAGRYSFRRIHYNRFAAIANFRMALRCR
ncbi:hypothetical protein KCP76_17125 [Salmonella enterica subsp. enterica serovar Weltevreden]|nr:hypothetical protein KCP76_17125 [Salmonella enterica subsp. enterica serovar Weltevreden]